AADAEHEFMSAGGTKDAFIRMLRDTHALVLTDGKTLSVRLQPGDVMRSTILAIRNRLTKCVDTGAPGVLKDNFLTPTLRLTAAWIDLGSLLAANFGSEAAAFGLARAVEYKLEQPTSDSWVVAAGPGFEGRLARLVKECLGLSAQVLEVPGELDLDAPLFQEHLTAGAPVLLVVDLVSTENSARRALANIIGQGAEPVALVTVIDARASPQPIRILNRSIQVISLASVAINSRQELDTSIAIDPLLRRPAATSAGSGLEHRFIHWCRSVLGSLQIGHIQGISGAHFTAFPLIGRLMDDPAVSGEIVDQIIDLADLREEGVSLWFPQSVSGSADLVANAVARQLEARGLPPRSMHSIPRARAAGRWIFPSNVDVVDTPGHVLILDWGAVTSATINQLIRLAANGGATRISAVIVLSELHHNEADSLRILNRVRGRRNIRDAATLFDEFEPAEENFDIEVSVEFVTTAALEGFSPGACPTCAVRDRYRLLSSSSSARLREHAREMVNALRPTDYSDTTGAGKDVLGGVISNEVSAEYMRWRQLLQAALEATPLRQEVISRVETIAFNHSEAGPRDALLRLLAAEPQWLKLPPLRYNAGRALLQELCTSVLSRSRGVEVIPNVRLMSIGVFASSRPEHFVESMPTLVEELANDSRLLDELFCQYDQVLRRPSRDSPTDQSAIVASIRKTREFISRDHAPHGLNEKYLGPLLSLNLHARYHEPTEVSGVQETWQRLRNDFATRIEDHDLEHHWIVVTGRLDQLKTSRQRLPEEVRSRTLRELENAIANMTESVLRYLPIIKPLLESDHYRQVLTSPDHARLLNVADGNWAADLEGLIEDVGQLFTLKSTIPTGDWDQLYRRVLSNLEWWRDTFVISRRAEHARRADMFEVITDTPTPLGPAITQGFAGADVDATGCSPGIADLSVFVPSRLLAEVISHVRANAEVRHRDPGKPVQYLIKSDVIHVQATKDTPTVALQIFNSGSRVDAEDNGRGLAGLNAKLLPFGSSVRGGTPGSTGWTYRAEIRVPVWLGATL
ncbi:MAG: hypothetical protein JWR83_1695, partial [Aeromicrobium sp.]|nr:hypothetical protein [Aeromicrobium sp.]